MNKLYSSIILLMLTVTLASCGPESTETKVQPEPTKAENVESETTEPETQEKVEAETQEEAAEEPVEVVKTEAPDQPWRLDQRELFSTRLSGFPCLPGTGMARD